MKQRSSFLWRVTNNPEFLAEPLPGIPVVELAGDRRVLIENHHGVREYGRQKIRVQVLFGQICVCGECLELSQMSKEQLVITGRIDCITVSRGEK